MRGNVKWTEKIRRLLRYYYNKAVREKGTPEYIARGWAIGMFVGFAVPFGLQLVISIPLSFLMKGSKLGATVGTMTTNHFTIFIIYPFQCWLGSRLIGSPLELKEIRAELGEVFLNQDYATLFSLGKTLIASFFIGGFLFAFISTPICYYLVKYLVIEYRRGKALRCRKKLEEASHGKPS